METSLTCLSCIVNNFKGLLDRNLNSNPAKETAMGQFLHFLADADYTQSPPVLGREIHRIIREILDDPDPYREIKDYFNRLVMDMYPELNSIVQESNDPLHTALKLAIAGNAIDFGSQYKLDVLEKVRRLKEQIITIDDSSHLLSDLQSANTLLYVGDNCGEIVFDKLVLEQLTIKNIYFAVRGGPVLNDATMDDAKLTGINKLAQIITTGDNAPGAVWESVSDEFQEIYNQADVIIAKGQGNFEGLSSAPGNIYFLFIAKCDLIASRLGATPGDFIIKRGNQYAKKT